MVDEPGLLHLPESGRSSLVVSGARSKIVARGRIDAAALSGRRLLALVRIGHEWDLLKWGLIDKSGAFVIEPVYHALSPFACGLARFSASPLVRQYPTACFKGRDGKYDLFQSARGRFGYLGLGGEVALAPRFDSARSFSEGAAGAEVDGKWGFINANGTFVIPPKFDEVRDFVNGLAIAKSNGMCGFVDRSGSFVIEPRVDFLWEFSEGLACAEIDGKYGYLDHRGAFAIEPRFDSAFDFVSGVARVVLDGRRCLIDANGSIIFQCSDKDEKVWGIAGGVAIVSRGEGPSYRGNYIDMKGRPILRDDSLNAQGSFSEGLGVVFRIKDGHRRYGYADLKGEVKIEPQYRIARPFNDGLAQIGPAGSRLSGFITKDGVFRIKPKFTHVGDFRNGLAKTRNDKEDMPVGMGQGKWGFIDSDGDVVISCQFDQANDFEEIKT